MKMILLILPLFLILSSCNKDNTSGVSKAHQEEQSKANTSENRTEINNSNTPRDTPP